VDSSHGRSALEITRATVGFRCVLSASGDIDTLGALTLRAALDDVLRSGQRDIWIDFTAVQSLEPAALQPFLDAKRELDRDRRQLVLICPPGNVRRILQHATVDHSLLIFDTRADAHRLS
jgi:anti-anti-sigma factor